MATVMRIVCLANSRKPGGRCVAGKRLSEEDRGHWVRPVSCRTQDSVSWEERKLPGECEPALLDVLDVPVLEAKALRHQPENWLLDASVPWSRVGRLAWEDLPGLADDPDTLWANGGGTNELVPVEEAEGVSASLYLLDVADSRLVVRTGPQGRQLRLVFGHRSCEYNLAVTDPVMEDKCRRLSAGLHLFGRCVVTVSLGEPYGKVCYKLVAAVITQAAAGAT